MCTSLIVSKRATQNRSMSQRCCPVCGCASHYTMPADDGLNEVVSVRTFACGYSETATGNAEVHPCSKR